MAAPHNHSAYDSRSWTWWDDSTTWSRHSYGHKWYNNKYKNVNSYAHTGLPFTGLPFRSNRNLSLSNNLNNSDVHHPTRHRTSLDGTTLVTAAAVTGVHHSSNMNMTRGTSSTSSGSNKVLTKIESAPLFVSELLGGSETWKRRTDTEVYALRGCNLVLDEDDFRLVPRTRTGMTGRGGGRGRRKLFAGTVSSGDEDESSIDEEEFSRMQEEMRRVGSIRLRKCISGINPPTAVTVNNDPSSSSKAPPVTTMTTLTEAVTALSIIEPAIVTDTCSTPLDSATAAAANASPDTTLTTCGTSTIGNMDTPSSRDSTHIPAESKSSKEPGPSSSVKDPSVKEPASSSTANNMIEITGATTSSSTATGAGAVSQAPFNITVPPNSGIKVKICADPITISNNDTIQGPPADSNPNPSEDNVNNSKSPLNLSDSKVNNIKPKPSKTNSKAPRKYTSTGLRLWPRRPSLDEILPKNLTYIPPIDANGLKVPKSIQEEVNLGGSIDMVPRSKIAKICYGDFNLKLKPWEYATPEQLRFWPTVRMNGEKINFQQENQWGVNPSSNSENVNNGNASKESNVSQNPVSATSSKKSLSEALQNITAAKEQQTTEEKRAMMLMLRTKLEQKKEARARAKEAQAKANAAAAAAAKGTRETTASSTAAPLSLPILGTNSAKENLIPGSSGSTILQLNPDGSTINTISGTTLTVTPLNPQSTLQPITTKKPAVNLVGDEQDIWSLNKDPTPTNNNIPNLKNLKSKLLQARRDDEFFDAVPYAAQEDSDLSPDGDDVAYQMQDENGNAVLDENGNALLLW